MNEILQPLRSYSSLAEMLVKRHEYLNYKTIVPLIASRTTLIPFTLVCSKTDTHEHLITTCTAVNYKTGVAINILANMSFTFGLDNVANPLKQYIVYTGNSIIYALPQGVYYLHLISEDDEWFVGLFKVGFYTKVCTFEFRNSTSFGDMWMIPKQFGITTTHYYKAVYEAYTFDQGEFNEYSEANKNDDNFDIFTYQRADKLRAVAILGDSDALDALKIIKMCDTIYLTDERGIRSEVELMEITGDGFGQSNYLTIIVKYRIIGNSIISVNETPVENTFMQTGINEVVESDNLTLGGHPLHLGGTPITLHK